MIARALLVKARHGSIHLMTLSNLSRLASIEEAQRELCRGTKRREFLRFARRKWLASDLAAETVQRVFRGHIGRRRAALNAEVQRLTGEAHAEWVEVRYNKKKTRRFEQHFCRYKKSFGHDVRVIQFDSYEPSCL